MVKKIEAHNQVSDDIEDSLEEMAVAYFRQTTAMQKVFKLKKRIRAVSGGTAAGKSIAILTWIIDYAQSVRLKKVDVVSESFPHLEMGVMEDFKSIMRAQGYWEDARWHGTKFIYTFETGTTVRFFSVDNMGKAHGPRRDVLFVNECNNLPYNIVDQLITRTRSIVWLDWNPSVEFWFYTEMLGHRDDIDFIGDGGNFPPLTYKDNEALLEEPGQLTIKEIESHKHNTMWWRVYGEGKLGDVEAKIYRGWKMVNGIPEGAKLLRYWVDFGYSFDPCSIGALYKYNDAFILDELAHRRGMNNEAISTVILNQPEQNVLTICDSAEPKSIDELISYGVSAVGAIKGPDSVLYGIRTMQAQTFYITKRSVNIRREYRTYQWRKDKNGNITTIPEDGDDHAMDGSRMAVTSVIKPEKKKTRVVRTKDYASYNRTASPQPMHDDDGDALPKAANVKTRVFGRRNARRTAW